MMRVLCYLCRWDPVGTLIEMFWPGRQLLTDLSTGGCGFIKFEISNSVCFQQFTNVSIQLARDGAEQERSFTRPVCPFEECLALAKCGNTWCQSFRIRQHSKLSSSCTPFEPVNVRQTPSQSLMLTAHLFTMAPHLLKNRGIQVMAEK